jgi:lactate dehydrogenase-like 2-hydroxyacid dehydrogenase
MKKKIVVSGKYKNEKMKELKEKFNVIETFDTLSFKKEVVDADAVLSIHPIIDEALLCTTKNLKLISQASTGYDNLDIPACTKHNVQVCNSPQLNEEVADIALFHIINAMRKCSKASVKLKKGDWYHNPCVGMEINHKNLLIVGYGRIGKTIAKKARVLGLNLYATSPHLFEDDVKSDYTVKAISFEDGIVLADIVVLALPLNKNTHHIINKDVLKIMKDTSVLVNISRGDLVDSEELIKALDNGDLNYASLDVFEGEPLASDNEAFLVDNLYLTPHIGSFTLATRDRMQQDAIENVINYFEGNGTRFKVNTIK